MGLSAANYFETQVQAHPSVAVETKAHDGRHMEIIAKEESENTFQSFLESLPHSLRSAISFDVNLEKLLGSPLLSVYFTDLMTDTDTVQLRTPPQDQLQKTLESRVCDIVGYANQGTNDPTIADIPVLKKESETKFTITIDLKSKYITPNTITHHYGNFPYCTSLSLDTQSNTLTYFFEYEFSTPTMSVKTPIADRILKDHFFVCPECETQSVVHYSTGQPNPYKLLTCVNCNTTAVLEDLQATMGLFEYHSVTDALQSLLVDIKQTPKTNFDTKTAYITAESVDPHQIMVPEHTFTTDETETTYAIDIKTEENPIGDDLQSVVLTEFSAPVITEYIHEDWSDDPIGTAHKKLLNNYCPVCTDNSFEESPPVQISHQRYIPTDDYPIANTDTRQPVDVFICTACYKELQQLVQNGIQKNSEQFVTEFI